MLSLLTLLFACGDKETDTNDVVVEPTAEPADDTSDCMVGRDPDDMDCDGFSEADGDCDDSTALVYPGATEIPYDGRDNDCAGDGDLNDLDQDGYVGANADGGDDCDDNNAEVYPGAPEICYDGIDQDCAGDVELENNNDCDGDGHIGRGQDATDCDDTNADVNPEAEEIWYDGIDQNCDQLDDFDQDGDGDPIAEIDVDGDGVFEETWDANNDGFLEYEGGTDCDDTEALTSPMFIERWDDADRNCDGVVDAMLIADAQAMFGATAGVAGGLGMSSAVVGDITGDGIAEIMIGAPFSYYDVIVDPDSGATTRENYDGAAFIMDLTNDGAPGDVAYAHIQGPTNGGALVGWDMASMGDLNGGGLNDIMVASPLSQKAYLFMGEDFTPNATLLLGSAHANVQAVGFGVDVANAGDSTGDGIPEVALGGSFILGGDAAWVAVYDGADVLAGGPQSYSSALFTIDSSNGTAIGGETVGNVDFDGDGLMDLAVAWGVTGTGKVAMVSGADIANGGSIAHADLTPVTGSIGTEFGRHNASATDINGDGLGELVVSAGYADSTTSDGTENEHGGIVYVFNGDELAQGGGASSSAYIEIHGSELAGTLQVIDQLGDNDGDGLTDLVVAAVNEDFTTNQPDVYTYMFKAASINAGGTFDAAMSDASIGSFQGNLDLFGYSGVSADIDYDGDDDLLIGAPRSGYQIGMPQNFIGSYSLGNLVVLESAWFAQ